MVPNAPECRPDMASQCQDQPQTMLNRRYRFSCLHPNARLRSLDTSQTETRTRGEQSGNEHCADVKTRITTHTTTIKYPRKCRIITFKISSTLLQANAGRQSQTAHYRLHSYSSQLVVVTNSMACVIISAVEEGSLKKQREENFKRIFLS